MHCDVATAELNRSDASKRQTLNLLPLAAPIEMMNGNRASVTFNNGANEEVALPLVFNDDWFVNQRREHRLPICERE